MTQEKGCVPSIPLSSIVQLYSPLDIPAQNARYKSLIESFRSTYPNRSPKFIVRAPGRVNLIGEHIDYAGFGVLPMAIGRDILIAVDTSDDDKKVRITNVNGEKYKPDNWDFEGKGRIVEIIVEAKWSNYFKCGYKVPF